MFLQNVMIAALARGLETYHSLLRRVLAISPHEMVVCGMSIGFADLPEQTQRTTHRQGAG